MNPDSPVPDPEVPAKAIRRLYSNADKARILDAFESASPIERASLCRREAVYINTVYKWRRLRAQGTQPPVRRGPKTKQESSERTALEKRNVLLEAKLKKAEQVIDIQGKVYALLRACAGESADHLVLLPWQK